MIVKLWKKTYTSLFEKYCEKILEYEFIRKIREVKLKIEKLELRTVLDKSLEIPTIELSIQYANLLFNLSLLKTTSLLTAWVKTWQ